MVTSSQHVVIKSRLTKFNGCFICHEYVLCAWTINFTATFLTLSNWCQSKLSLSGVPRGKRNLMKMWDENFEIALTALGSQCSHIVLIWVIKFWTSRAESPISSLSFDLSVNLIWEFCGNILSTYAVIYVSTLILMLKLHYLFFLSIIYFTVGTKFILWWGVGRSVFTLISAWILSLLSVSVGEFLNIPAKVTKWWSFLFSMVIFKFTL